MAVEEVEDVSDNEDVYNEIDNISFPFILTRTTRATSQVTALSGIVVFVVVQVHEALFMVQECVKMLIILINILLYIKSFSKDFSFSIT